MGTGLIIEEVRNPEKISLGLDGSTTKSDAAVRHEGECKEASSKNARSKSIEPLSSRVPKKVSTTAHKLSVSPAMHIEPNPMGKEPEGTPQNTSTQGTGIPISDYSLNLV